MDPDLILNMFESDAFSVETLTAYVNGLPFVPGRVGQLGLFQEEGVPTTSIAIESLDGTISLIPNTPRGAAPNQNIHDKRVLRNLTIPHFPMQDIIRPSEVQNVRPFGGGSLTSSIQWLVQQRMARMTNNLDATLEYGRLGALKGIILDSDGSTVIYNLFTEFGISQSTVNFALGTDDTDVEGQCEAVSGNVEDALGSAAYDHIHVLCGKTFWRNFITHPKVVAAYQYYQQPGGNPLREDLRYRGFTFGGLVFEQYRGKVNGISFIADSEAYAFPVGVPGLFISRFAPADYLDTVNTVGLARYARAYVHRKLDAIDLDVESNPLSVCTRPAALNKLTVS